MPLNTIATLPDATFVSSGSILLGGYRQSGSMSAIDALARAASTIARARGKVIMVTIIPASAISGRVPDDVKQRSAEIISTLGPSLVGSGMVILGSGFGATLLRTFMTGFNLFAKMSAPTKVVSSMDDMLKWLETVAPGELKGTTADEIVKAVGLTEQAAKAA